MDQKQYRGGIMRGLLFGLGMLNIACFAVNLANENIVFILVNGISAIVCFIVCEIIGRA